MTLLAGCATPRYQLPPGLTISEAERTRCEKLARAEAKRAWGQAFGSDVAGGGGGGLAGAAYFPPALFLLLPLGLIGGAWGGGHEAKQAWAGRFDTTMRECVEPIRLAQTLGPDDPSVARSLAGLATRFAAVERPADADLLYRRAAAIYERAGPESNPRDGVTLFENYAAFLHTRKREKEAAALEARAQAIREEFRPRASLSPPSHDFGAVVIGGPGAEATFTLRNVGTHEFTVGAAVSGAPFAYSITSDTCSNTTLPAGATCTLTATFVPIPGAQVPGTLLIEVVGSLSERLEASLTGTGTEPPGPPPTPTPPR